MLHVLPTTFEPVLQQIRLQGLFSWVVKRAALLFNSFCSNVAKKVARFFCCLFTVPLTAPPLLRQENENENENENEDKGYDDNEREIGNENEDEDEKEYEYENENGDDDESESEKNMKLKVKMRRIMKMMMTMILTIISYEYTRYLAHDSLSLYSDDEL